MRKAYLKYVGILLVIMAAWIATDTLIHTPRLSQGILLAAMLLIVGVSSIRKAREQH